MFHKDKRILAQQYIGLTKLKCCKIQQPDQKVTWYFITLKVWVGSVRQWVKPAAHPYKITNYRKMWLYNKLQIAQVIFIISFKIPANTSFWLQLSNFLMWRRGCLFWTTFILWKGFDPKAPESRTLPNPEHWARVWTYFVSNLSDC